MPKIVDDAEQRRRIRAAARRVWSRRGMSSGGLAPVAAAAGMRRSNLYHYYDDKAALIRDVAEEVLAEEEALFDAALATEGSPLERVERLFSSVARLFAGRTALGRLLLETWASEPRRVRSTLRRIRASLADLLREGQRRGEIDRGLDAKSASLLLVSLLDGLMVQVFVDPSAAPAPAQLERSLLASVRRLLAP